MLQSHPRARGDDPRRHERDDHVAAALAIGGPQRLAVLSLLEQLGRAIALAEERAEMALAAADSPSSSMGALSMACIMGPPHLGENSIGSRQI